MITIYTPCQICGTDCKGHEHFFGSMSAEVIDVDALKKQIELQAFMLTQMRKAIKDYMDSKESGIATGCRWNDVLEALNLTETDAERCLTLEREYNKRVLSGGISKDIVGQ